MSYELQELGAAPQLYIANRWLDPTPEVSVIAAYERGLRYGLAKDVLSQYFSAADTQARLPLFVDTITPAAVSTAFESETGRIDQPLHQLLGRSALNGTVTTDLRPPAPYVSGIRAQIADMPPDFFSRLDTFHAIIEQTGLLEVARSVQNIAESGADYWGDAAFDIIDAAVTEDFDDFAVPEGSEYALALLCFLPHDCRKLTRRLIANSTFFAHIERQLGTDISEDEGIVLNAIKYFLKSDVVTGQQWTDLHLSDAVMESMALTSTTALQHIATIQKSALNGRAPRIADYWRQSAVELSNIINTTGSDTKLFRWASTDTGHCFSGFTHYDLENAFLSDDIVHHNALPVKDGSRAVILEDNVGQMAIWQWFVRDFCPQTTDETLCFVNPQGVAEAADDPSVSLFLIDIQSGDDTAGILVAEAILRKRYALLEAANFDQEAVPPTNIVIWSASQHSLETATEYMQPILDSMRDIYYERYPAGGGGLGGARINVEIRPKGMDVMDLPLVRTT